MKKFERETIRKNEAEIIEKIKAAGGEVIELTPEERARWVKATAGIPDMFKDEVPQSLVQEMLDTVK